MNLWPLIAFTAGAVSLAVGVTVAAFRFAPSDPGPMDEDTPAAPCPCRTNGMADDCTCDCHGVVKDAWAEYRATP